MKLGTLRTYNGTVAVVVGATTATTIGGITDVGSLLKLKNWREVAFAASGGVYPLASIDKMGTSRSASRQDSLCRIELPQAHP